VRECVIEIKVGTSKHLPPLAVAEMTFDVRQNRCTKELGVLPHLAAKAKVD
jgi:hypothetical protein